MALIVTLGQQYNTGKKPTVALYTNTNRHAGTPDKNKTTFLVDFNCITSLFLVLYEQCTVNRVHDPAPRSLVLGCLFCLSKITPKISATEAAALDAGTIGFDRDLFNGTASLQGLKDKYKLVTLSPREQAFIDNEVKQALSSNEDGICISNNVLSSIWLY